MDVKGKKALVFGGTSGIGLAAVKQLAEKGAEVIAISRNPDKAAGNTPANVTLKACDVLDCDALVALFRECAPFDIVISSATGGDRAIGPFMEMDMDGFQGSFAKLWGYANVVRLGAEYMSDNGSIVLVSGSPARTTGPGMVALGAVGAAVEQLARYVAVEIAPKRLNVVSPGVIDTPMSALEGAAREDYYRNGTKDFAIPRAGTSEEVAKAIVFMVENDFVTGTTIDVDGGWLLS